MLNVSHRPPHLTPQQVGDPLHLAQLGLQCQGILVSDAAERKEYPRIVGTLVQRIRVHRARCKLTTPGIVPILRLCLHATQSFRIVCNIAIPVCALARTPCTATSSLRELHYSDSTFLPARYRLTLRIVCSTDRKSVV